MDRPLWTQVLVLCLLLAQVCNVCCVGVSSRVWGTKWLSSQSQARATTPVTFTSLESEGFERSHDLLESFSSILREELQVSLSGERSWNVTEMQSVIADAVEQASSFHYATHSDVLDRLQNTAALNITSEQARNNLQQEMTKLVRDVLRNSIDYQVSMFYRRLTRVNGGPNLLPTIERLKKRTLETVKQQMISIRKGLEKVLNMKTEEGLLAVPSSPSSDLTIPLDISFEARRVSETLDTAGKEHVDLLVVEGLHNPFVRASVLPPTMINLNYLFNPQFAWSNWQLNKLYDIHRPGIAADRADALQFSGVASIPFDPNEHSIPKELPMNTWEVVKQFFTADPDKID